MKQCAFCIPLHQKHFIFGLRIAKVLESSDSDLYFIFTEKKDENEFIQYSKNKNFSSLILSDFCNIDICRKQKNFVSVKKMYALSKLCEFYEYIACIDSEVVFLKKNNFYEMMKEIVESKVVIGGKERHKSYIIETSLISLTPKEDRNALQNLSMNFSVYTWWSDVPVYDCSIVKDFLHWVRFSQSTIQTFSWFFFENLAYNYFCVLKHNYRLNIPSYLSSSLEAESSSNIEKVSEEIKLHWVNANAFNENKMFYKNFYIIFHVDRLRRGQSLLRKQTNFKKDLFFKI
jgi:hypothetical protein